MSRRRAWGYFLTAFGIGLALVTAGALVRYNQVHPIALTSIDRDGSATLGHWRMSVRTPLRETGVPGSSAGPGVDSMGNPVDQEGAAWLYIEIDAEPLEGIDFEYASCNIELRTATQRWDSIGFIDTPHPTFCGDDSFPREAGATRTVSAYFQVPVERLDDDPYAVIIVPGFPARAVKVQG